MILNSEVPNQVFAPENWIYNIIHIAYTLRILVSFVIYLNYFKLYSFIDSKSDSLSFWINFEF